jgi:uncharacterized protein
MSDDSPCLTCGACCATFRVSFYWGELESAGGQVPDALTERVNLHLCAMQGTNQAHPKCTALQGEVGQQVSCNIYHQRPTPCREFDYNAPGQTYNEGCDKARARFGLAPLAN